MAYLKIKDQTEADQALAEIGKAQRAIAKIELDLNHKVDRLKSEALEAASELKDQVSFETSRLKKFATTYREDVFKGKQSLELTHGKFGFRRSSTLALTQKGDTWDEVVKRLEEQEQLEAVKVKKEVNKEYLEKWSEDRLLHLGVAVKPKESFYVEVAEEKV
jgi:phage host-nuclease inhibitor protein Gam